MEDRNIAVPKNENTLETDQNAAPQGSDNGMSESEILGLEGWDLTAKIYELMGAKWLDGPDYRGLLYGVAYVIVKPHEGPVHPWSNIEGFHKSLDAIRPVVEKCVEECGHRFIIALSEAVNMRRGIFCGPEDMILSTATDQCRAVLLAYHRKAQLGERFVSGNEENKP